ncbi:MAG: thioesterase family protein [Acidimicrobiia bacterium]|nr:thioesterase family protein [Acidimicrobiia bacterium]
MTDDDVLFRRDGDRFIPTDLTIGPWDQRAQHGGAPAALLTHAIELVEAPAPMQVARLTFELMRPVPIAPLRVRTELVRPGRKVQLVQASLLADDDVEVMRATALRIRIADLELPALPAPPGDVAPEPPLPRPPEQGTVQGFPGSNGATWRGFHSHANEIRFVEGGFAHAGPAVGWFRLLVPVVDGEPTSPTMRVVAAADFGNGVAWTLPRANWIFINPDLTVHLVRPPTGEWIGLRSATYPAGGGMAMAESALYDRDGRVGRSVQSLILDRQ